MLTFHFNWGPFLSVWTSDTQSPSVPLYAALLLSIRRSEAGWSCCHGGLCVEDTKASFEKKKKPQTESVAAKQGSCWCSTFRVQRENLWRDCHSFDRCAVLEGPVSWRHVRHEGHRQVGFLEEGNPYCSLMQTVRNSEVNEIKKKINVGHRLAVKCLDSCFWFHGFFLYCHDGWHCRLALKASKPRWARLEYGFNIRVWNNCNQFYIWEDLEQKIYIQHIEVLDIVFFGYINPQISPT